VEGLVALQSLCRSTGDVARASLAAANGIELLSEMAQSSNDKIQRLSSGILSDTLGGVREAL
jgi:hypothetical protein